MTPRQEYYRQWAAANPEKVKAAQARYKAKYPERVAASHKKWKEENRDKRNAARRAWRAKNRERLSAQDCAWFLKERLTKEGNAKRMLRNAKTTRSKKACLITQADILAVWPADDKCPVFGVPFIYGSYSRDNKGAAPSLDRIDSTRGYEPGNIAVISWRANEMKRHYTAQDILALARWIATVTRRME